MKCQAGDLNGARATVDKSLARLTNATEFAILGNTEGSLKMSEQLDQNQKQHAEMLRGVKRTMGSIREDTSSIKSDVSKLLQLFSK